MLKPKMGQKVMLKHDLGWRGPFPLIEISQFNKPVVRVPGFGTEFGLTCEWSWIRLMTEGEASVYARAQYLIRQKNDASIKIDDPDPPGVSDPNEITMPDFDIGEALEPPPDLNPEPNFKIIDDFDFFWRERGQCPICKDSTKPEIQPDGGFVCPKCGWML